MRARSVLLFFFMLLGVGSRVIKAKTALTPKIHANSTATHARAKTPQALPKRDITPSEEKEWNVFLYMAGRNNLHPFIEGNLKQIQSITPSPYINFIVQVDKFGTKEITRSAISGENMLTYWRSSDIPTDERTKNPARYNSGGVENFIDFVVSGSALFKARKTCIIVWDHGSGCYDPVIFRASRILPDQDTCKGMAFNETQGLFLSNQDLTHACQRICADALHGKPIDILNLDICHGSALETAVQVKNLVRYIVASQEVEIGWGQNHGESFARASTKILSPYDVVTDMIASYKKVYNLIMPDHTLSVIDLVNTPENSTTTYFDALLQSIDDLARALLSLWNTPLESTIKTIFSDVRKKPLLSCSFYDDAYIDLHLFLMSLQHCMRQTMMTKDFKNKYLDYSNTLHNIITLSVQAIQHLYQVVPLYTAGVAFLGKTPRARGISITFPLKYLHSSYPKTLFAQTNSWFPLLKKILGR